jgi:hypothetical protein
LIVGQSSGFLPSTSKDFFAINASHAVTPAPARPIAKAAHNTVSSIV